MTDGDAKKPDGSHPVAFISHHSSQEQTARHLKKILQRNGIDGWMAPDDIEPGRPFDEAIVEQVADSDLIVLLFCAKSDQSRHVKRELIMADNNRKLVYPVRLEDIDAKGLAYWLNDYQWIDWIDRRDETIQRMVDTIKKQFSITGDTATTEGQTEEPTTAPDEPAPPEPPIDDSPGDEAKAAPAMGLASLESTGSASLKDRLEILRNKWVAIGAGAVVAALILGLIVNAMTRPSEFTVRPGTWETRYDMTRIIRTGGMDRAALRAWRENFEANVDEQCVTEAIARAPRTAFFDPGNDNNCSTTSLEMADGDFTGQMLCRPAGVGGNVRITMVGDYSYNQAEAAVEYVFRPGAANEFRFVATVTKSRAGACD
jgi:hypothetical protein